MKSPAKKRYDKALDEYLLCMDASKLADLKRELDESEKAWRAENPGAYYQAAEQVAQLDEAPVNEDR